jgi:hypothetical protein
LASVDQDFLALLEQDPARGGGLNELRTGAHDCQYLHYVPGTLPSGQGK